MPEPLARAQHANSPNCPVRFVNGTTFTATPYAAGSALSTTPNTLRDLRAHDNALGQAALLVVVVFGIAGLHTIEIWLYAMVYLGLGALGSLEEAVYFSTVTFVTLGYGDIVLDKAWRLLSAIEAANGMILAAWSTAFLIAVTARLRALEHDWLKPREPRSGDDNPAH